MPDSFQSVAVLALALIPGALYIWGFERIAGRWGIGVSDRILRFVGGSAVFQAMFAPLSYWIWAEHWNDFTARRELPLALWVVPLVYVALPALAGTVVGIATKKKRPWARLLTGPDPAPRAWDYLFSDNPDGWIRVKLKSGTWLGGSFAEANGRSSYVAGYPESQDLYLAAAARVDPDTGESERNQSGDAVLLTSGILLRWDEIEYLVFTDA